MGKGNGKRAGLTGVLVGSTSHKNDMKAKRQSAKVERRQGKQAAKEH